MGLADKPLDPLKNYKCPQCGFVCKEGDMLPDETVDGEYWSNWICPNEYGMGGCGAWLYPNDWIPVEAKPRTAPDTEATTR